LQAAIQFIFETTARNINVKQILSILSGPTKPATMNDLPISVQYISITITEKKKVLRLIFPFNPLCMSARLVLIYLKADAFPSFSTREAIRHLRHTRHAGSAEMDAVWMYCYRLLPNHIICVQFLLFPGRWVP
jgi:hypothetical protein